ncbi:MAG: hypothetical protein HY207_07495 [Nitrospirae bacterium]|nr:hypothetical protein [Nitrospirota bacterium]
MEMVYYQALATAIQGLAAQGVRTLVVTSGGPAEGKSSVTAQCGRALASFAKQSVVVVDSDRIKPTLHTLLGVRNPSGVGEALHDVSRIDLGKADSHRLGVGDWVELLRIQEKTGRLMIAGDHENFSLIFHRGRIFGAYWPQRPDERRLGSLLVQAGRITEDERDAALQTLSESGHALGDTLHRLGYLEPTDLHSSLDSQLKECLYRMSMVREPKILFSEVPETDRESEVQTGAEIDAFISRRFRDYLKQPFLSAWLPTYLKATDVNNLKVMTSGAIPFDLQDRATAERFKALLDGLARRFDVVLVDAPPVALASSAATLAALADGVLLVVKADGLQARIIQQAKEQLERVKANLVGVVLNQVDLKDHDYLNYYYGLSRR